MLRVCVAELRKTFLLFIDDRAQVVMLFLIPLIIVFFASFAIQGLITSSSRYRLPVVDLDQTPASRAIIDGLENDAQLQLEVRTGSAFEAQGAADTLGGGKRIAVLVIPLGTGAALESGEQAKLPMYVDPTQSARYGLMFLAVERALYRSAAPAAAVKIISDAAGVPEAAVTDLVGREVDAILDEPVVDVNAEAASRGQGLPNAYDQTVPGIALMWAMSVFAFAVWLIDDERRLFRTWPRTLGTQGSRMGLLFGRFLTSYAYVAVVVGFLFTVGALVFDMNVGDPAALAGVLAVYATVPAALGTLMAVSGLDRQLAYLLGNVGMFVVGAVSGALVPLYVLPAWLERVAIVSPLYWAKDAAQDVMIRGATLTDVAVPMLALAAIASVCLAAAAMRLRVASQ